MKMMRNIETFRNMTILARDGEIGKIHDIFFDDITWTVRYLVVDVGHWLTGRRVLISPEVVEHVRWDDKQVVVSLTKAQVEQSPDINTDKPVSLQHQIALHTYYAWPYYWNLPGYYPTYSPIISTLPEREPSAEESEHGDPHLRSANEVTGYHIQTTDGEIGHVEDLLVEEDSWAIRYMVVDTRNWLPGRKVLVSPRWITGVSWYDRKVTVFMSQEAVKQSPEYDPSVNIDRNYEERLHDHYKVSKYWAQAMLNQAQNPSKINRT